MSDTACCLSFTFWRTSLGIINSRSPHVVAKGVGGGVGREFGIIDANSGIFDG